MTLDSSVLDVAECLPPVHSLLERAHEERTFAAGQCCVFRKGELVHSSSHGRFPGGDSVSEEALFDIASVSKMVGTTLAIALLVEHGELRLDMYARKFFPDLDSRVTLRELLGHRSGLPAWEPLFLAAREHSSSALIYPDLDPGSLTAEMRSAAFVTSRAKVIERAARASVQGRRGTRVYSDLGFILLGRLVEVAASSSLNRFVADEVFSPLGLESSRYFDLAKGEGPGEVRVLPTGVARPRPPIAEQEELYKRGPELAEPDYGEVDDDNAFAMGGVAGHAGIFSTAGDMARLGWLLYEELHGSNRLGAGESLREFALPDPNAEGPLRALGFDLPGVEASSAGSLLGKAGPRGAIGHLGFTGCSLWLDLDAELSVALLTNRVFPNREGAEAIRELRPMFHDCVVESLR